MMMNKEKFKVGDRVKLIDVAENPGKGWIISTTESLTVKNVKRISAYSKTILTVETFDGRWAIVSESDIRKIEGNTLNKKGFKLGDRVVVITPKMNISNSQVINTDDICTIEEIIETGEESSVLKIKVSDGRWGYVNEKDIIKEDDILKEGDLVKAISEDRESPDIVKGNLLVVRRTQRPTDKYILVSKKDDMSFMSIFPKDKLEKVSYEKPGNMTDTVFYKVLEDMTEYDKKFLEGLNKNGKIETSPKCESVDTGEGMKNDFLDDKPRWDLLPLQEIEDLVKVYTAGAKKYASNSWQKLDNGYQRYKAALFRHLLAYEKGKRIDPDTKCMHLAQVAWNAVAMLWFDKNGKGLY